jgi:starch synthase
LRIVLVSSEIVPFSKTGGLGDVVGALALTLSKRGHSVLTVSPRYGSTPTEGFEDSGVTVRADLAGQTRWSRLLVRRDSRKLVHSLVQDHTFDRPGIYGDRNGSYGDNHLRYAMLSRAGIEAARHLPFVDKPLGENVVFHVHDWQTGLLPVYLNASYRPVGLFPKAPTVLTLHNIQHQGLFPASRFDELELPPRWMSPWGLEWHGAMSLLKAGIMQCEQLTTVSPTYAREIVQDGGAFGLEGVLRHRIRDLHGIRNGIDDVLWDPAKDPFLEANYDAGDLAGKGVNKAALQAELGLPVDPRVPILGSVGRLDPQKGVHWIVESIPWLVRTHRAQIVVLGSAAPAHAQYEHALREMERRFPRNVRAWIGFSERMAHRIEAGADLFVMPSVFEPCGLNQLYSLRYGTAPIVRATGGLADSVVPHDPGNDRGNGWSFVSQQGEAFREAMHWALTTWRHHPDAFTRMVRRGMSEDFSWDAVAPAYETVYEQAKARRVAMPI